MTTIFAALYFQKTGLGFGSTLGASLTFTEGEVEYQHASQGWKAATSGLNLSTGDSLRVLSQGKAILTIDDGSIVRLSPNSTITLTTLKTNNIVLTNTKGIAYHRVVKSKRRFIVKTADVSYESLGTAYSTLNTADKQGVEVYQSQVKVTTKDQTEIIVDEGKKYLLATHQVEALTPEEKKTGEVLASEDPGLTPTVATTATLAPSPTPEITATPTSLPPTATLTPKPTVASGIVLTGKVTESGISLHWTVTDMSTPNGFKIVKSTEANPVYPGNDYQYLSEPSVRDYTWDLKNGQTYYFRVCRYTEGKCDVYSNNLKLTAPAKSSESESKSGSVSSLSLRSTGGSSIAWDVNGNSPQGFKVVWSKNSSPTYPCRDGDKYHYYSDSGKRNDSLEAFDGSGKYYVRVCEYLGGRCGTYSNQIEINLQFTCS